MLRRVVLSQSARLARVAPQQQVRTISAAGVRCNEQKPVDGEPAAKATEDAAPAAEEGATTAEDAEALGKQVEELKAANTDLNDKLMRALADAENVRRISRQDVQNAREFAISKFAKSLLDVSDNLKRAHESISIEEMHPDHSMEAIKTLHEGVVMTDGQLQKVFREFKIVPVGEVGDKFDPNVHDALFEFEDPSKDAGSIGQLMKTGYMINSRCLRPAQVGVVKAKKAD